jgi:hypothetical protein
LFKARAVAVAAPAAHGTQGASNDVASAMTVPARRRGAAVEALDRDRMASMIAWAKRANGRERRAAKLVAMRLSGDARSPPSSWRR